MAGRTASGSKRRSGKGTDVLALLGTALLFLGLCACTDTGRAEAPGTSQESLSASARPPIERLRERLRARPREERARLERHLEEFEKLPGAARARLLERARALRAQESSLADLPARETNGPRSLGPERGDVSENDVFGHDVSGHTDTWHADLRERFRRRGREVRSRLPERLLRRLEQAPHEARRALFERLAERREPMSLRALAGMREHLGLPDEEIRRLERMPLAQRLQALRALHERRASERGRRGPSPR